MSLSCQVASPGCAEASAHPADRSDGTNGPPAPAETSAAPPLRSVYTTNFPALLDQLGISLLVTTYQAGKLVVLRADQDRINTHFRDFSKPMGLAVAGDRLAVGTRLEIWEFHNVPAVIPKLEPTGRHDACYLPRSSHVTGDVQIHEMAWVGDELWFVNTRFSCLCTRSASITSCRAGGRRSSPPWPPRTAAISTAWVCATASPATSPPWPQSDSRRAGGPTRRTAACSST